MIYGRDPHRRNCDLDPWRRLLSAFVGAKEAQQLATVREWRGLLSAFSGVRGALQASIGEPSASRCTFNAFEVTRRTGFEVTGIHRLLRDLLDPRGTHGQGGAFLQAFLAMVDDRSSEEHFQSAVAACGRPVECGARVCGGSGPARDTPGEPRSIWPSDIVIENKWDHRLTDRQLERYAEYLAAQGFGRRPPQLSCIPYTERRRSRNFVAHRLCLA